MTARPSCVPVMRPAGRPASPNGHCLINRSDRDAVFLEIGTRAKAERAQYPDIDLLAVKDESGFRYLHKSGEEYPKAG